MANGKAAKPTKPQPRPDESMPPMPSSSRRRTITIMNDLEATETGCTCIHCPCKVGEGEYRVSIVRTAEGAVEGL